MDETSATEWRMSPGRSGSWRSRDGAAEDVAKDGDQAVEGDRGAGGDVVGADGRRRRGRRKEDRLDDVGNVDEVARLLAVAVEDRPLPGAEGVDEAGDGRGVGAARILAGTVDVEEAQGDGLETVRPPEDGAEVLTGEFRRSVG